jgi:hypothetical protein
VIRRRTHRTVAPGEPIAISIDVAERERVEPRMAGGDAIDTTSSATISALANC